MIGQCGTAEEARGAWGSGADGDDCNIVGVEKHEDQEHELQAEIDIGDHVAVVQREERPLVDIRQVFHRGLAVFRADRRHNPVHIFLCGDLPGGFCKEQHPFQCGKNEAGQKVDGNRDIQ